MEIRERVIKSNQKPETQSVLPSSVGLCTFKQAGCNHDFPCAVICTHETVNETCMHLRKVWLFTIALQIFHF